MSWRYLPASVVSNMDSRKQRHDTESSSGQFVMSSGTTTASKSSRPGSGTASSMTRRSGMTSKNSTGHLGVDEFISSLGDFPAKTSRSGESEGVLLVSEAVFGSRCFGSFASLNRRSLSWRTFPACGRKVLTGSSPTWPRAGLMLNGKCYLLPPLVPPTFARGYSLLPTPVRIIAENINSYLRAHETWETSSNLTAKFIGIEFKLTGRAPRPTGRFFLSPSYVEWMMGFPTGWSGLEPLAMPSSLKSQSSSAQDSFIDSESRDS